VATTYFIDSSALVKRYVQEVGTSWVRGLTRRNPSTVSYIARITAVEVPCAIARRRKGKTIPPRRASSLLHRFRQHLAGRYAVAQVTPALLDNATRLGVKHALRAYDAVQLAVALKSTAFIKPVVPVPSHRFPLTRASTMLPWPNGWPWTIRVRIPAAIWCR
jgi:predicted nucleic acid-binding protein